MTESGQEAQRRLCQFQVCRIQWKRNWTRSNCVDICLWKQWQITDAAQCSVITFDTGVIFLGNYWVTSFIILTRFFLSISKSFCVAKDWIVLLVFKYLDSILATWKIIALKKFRISQISQNRTAFCIRYEKMIST